MNIVLTCPVFTPHGGIRIILEWANRLCDCGKVSIFCKKKCDPPHWFNLKKEVEITNNISIFKKTDLLIICSPHDIDLESCEAKKKIIFLQMLEHMFNGNPFWQTRCNKLYESKLPLIGISQWNIDWLKARFPNNKREYYLVGNGVNFDDFPIQNKNTEKRNKTILIEGRATANPTKDILGLGYNVARRLKAEGFNILGYGITPPRLIQKKIFNNFYVKPSLEEINNLYLNSSILIKATRYDARSCSPMEAMTKGCVPVRSIIHGDDDLVSGINCIRVGYNENALYSAAKSILMNHELRKKISEACIKYVQEYSWEYWMPKIKDILFERAE